MDREPASGKPDENRRGRPRPLRLFLVLLLLAQGSHTAAAERGFVVEVVDGDTLRVRSESGDRTVRLIGVDAPEKGHPARFREFLSGESADFLKDLCEGKEVLLEADREDTDAHGRSLRYVFLPVPDGRLANLELIRYGFARTLTIFPFSRKEDFVRAEEEARKEGRGIWKDGGMAELRWLGEGGIDPVLVYPAGGRKFAVVYGDRGRPGVDRGDLGGAVDRILRLRAENADEDFAGKAEEAGFRSLSATGSRARRVTAPSAGATVAWDQAHLHVGREVTVEGTIVRTHRAKSILFLNFHPNWKKYLSVVIFGENLPRFPEKAETYYLNKKVRVRGAVSLHKGRPEVVVKSPESITVVGESPGK